MLVFYFYVCDIRRIYCVGTSTDYTEQRLKTTYKLDGSLLKADFRFLYH